VLVSFFFLSSFSRPLLPTITNHNASSSQLLTQPHPQPSSLSSGIAMSSVPLENPAPAVRGNMITITKDEYEKLKQDLSLKEADNHFLSDELEQKDRMLSMLTEGLKEVRFLLSAGFPLLISVSMLSF
jgi:hypothetical protein